MTDSEIKSHLHEGDKVLLCIGSDSYDETVANVSSSWIIYIYDYNPNPEIKNCKKFKRFKRYKNTNCYHWIWKNNCYRLIDNTDGKFQAHLDESF